MAEGAAASPPVEAGVGGAQGAAAALPHPLPRGGDGPDVLLHAVNLVRKDTNTAEQKFYVWIF